MYVAFTAFRGSLAAGFTALFKGFNQFFCAACSRCFRFVMIAENMDDLTNLPSRCCFEVVEGAHALQPPSRAYLCWGTSVTGAVNVINTQRQLHEVYKQAQQQHPAVKRHLHQDFTDRIRKKNKPSTTAAGHGELEAALAIIDGGDDEKSAAAAAVQKAKQAEAAVAPLRQHRGTAAATPREQPVTGQPAATAQLTINSKSSKHVFTVEQLKTKTNKELVDLLRARSCPVSGQKLELIRRLLDYQRRLKKAQGPVQANKRK